MDVDGLITWPASWWQWSGLSFFRKMQCMPKKYKITSRLGNH